MAKHFISVLGTGLYEPVEYAFEGTSLGKYEFIQAALIRCFQSELVDGGRVSVFLTEGARKKNWENRIYDNRDMGFADRWSAEEKSGVIPGHTKQGLKEYLAKTFGTALAVEGISIEDANTESQIWSVFQTIYEKIEEGDEIIFDITHSFRSIPMLAITIINFARIVKNCTVCGIYYGAYEAKGEGGIAPIVNLTIYNDILQWTSATDTFIRYGNADQIAQLYGEKKKTLWKENKKDESSMKIRKEWTQLESVMKSMKKLADALATCRGIDASKLDHVKKNASEKSIRCAYQEFKQGIQTDYPESVKEIVPLHQLLRKAQENYSQFDKEKDYMIGCEVVRWSIQNNMTQQGYTALEETLKTYLCDMYDLDNRLEMNRDGIVGKILNAFAQFNQNTKGRISSESQYTSEARSEIRNFIIEKDDFTRKLYIDSASNPEELAKYDEITYTLPIELAMIAKKVKEKRNDINHFGFNPDPSSSEKLKITLKDNFEEFEKFLQENSAQFKEKIETYRNTRK